MYKIGDKVVYPMHGAGIIVEIAKEEVLGSRISYYILEMPVGNMRLMIPQDRVAELGLREIITEKDAEKLLEFLESGCQEMEGTWNQRHRNSIEKIKTGNIFEIGEVVYGLTRRSQIKVLSAGEKKLLQNAKQILISELVLAKGSSEEEIEKVLMAIFA